MTQFDIMTVRSILIAVMGHVCGLVAIAQSTQALDIQHERQRIAMEREHRETTFLQDERACYRRFAVSDCLRDARQLRRAALDELRRQELVLDDLVRKDRAAQTLLRIQGNIANDKNATPADR